MFKMKEPKAKVSSWLHCYSWRLPRP